MLCCGFYDAKHVFFEIVSSSKGTPFLKIPALPGNREKSSYRVSVSLPGVGKIPVASCPPDWIPEMGSLAISCKSTLLFASHFHNKFEAR